MSTQEIATSGIGPTDAQPMVLITFDGPQHAYGLPQPNLARNQDEVPGFMYLTGHVKYRKDQFGNILAENDSVL